MTLYACIKLTLIFDLKPSLHRVNVSGYASCMEGTTAELEKGDSLTIIDLLYGMMLPSGNDAATALA